MMIDRCRNVKDLSRIEGWERREPRADDGLTEDGEIWRNRRDPTQEVLIDHSNHEEPKNWSVVLPDGRQRFTQDKEIAKGIAGLYMETGSL